jgi:riboflavin synthase
MFTGIIETLGVIQEIKKENSNIHITMNSTITGN